MCRFLFVALSALAFVYSVTACRSEPIRIAQRIEVPKITNCPANEVLFEYENINQCFPRCAGCPNGFCDGNKCYCFPGTGTDRAGGCGKICKNCENGWCSSVSKCECDEDYTRINDQCVHASKNCPKDHEWDPEYKRCEVYLNLRMDS